MIRLTVIALVATFALPAFSGGPVIREAPEATVRDRDHTVPLLLLGLAVAAIVLGGGDGDCVSQPTTPDGRC